MKKSVKDFKMIFQLNVNFLAKWDCKKRQKPIGLRARPKDFECYDKASRNATRKV